MIPGMNPRQMRQAMQRMGIQQQEIDASEVIIRTRDNKEIFFENPQVSKVNMMGQHTYQIVGEAVERAVETKVEINEDDVKTVMEQTGVSEEEARKAIEDADGDLAQAILDLQENKE
jgi:nascent polypeptide-associated complex subunit alpha